VNWVDIGILGVVGASTLMGLFWGLIRQVIAVVGLAGGIFFAGRFYEPIAQFLHGEDGGGLVADPNWAHIIAFVLVMVGFSLVLGVAASVLRVVANLLFLGWLDHLLGALIGLIMSVMLVMALLAVATVFPVQGLAEDVRKSQVAQWLSGFVPVVLAMLPPEFQDFRERMTWGLP
jgi:membrane protein required for colicin V production